MKKIIFIIMVVSFTNHYFSQNKKDDEPKDFVEYYTGTQKVKIKGKSINHNKTGEWVEYYESGKKLSVYRYKDGKLEGKYETFYENGVLRSSCPYKNNQRHGKSFDFYPSGKLQSKCEFSHGKFIKTEETFYENGKKECQQKASPDGYLSGDSKCWYPNGKLKNEKKYTDTLKNGVLKIYYPNGKIKIEEKIVNGFTESQKNYDSTGKFIGEKKFENSNDAFMVTSVEENNSVEPKEPEVFVYVTEMPTFPGGQTALDKYFADNNQYADSLQTKGLKGKCYIKFVVKDDGSIGKVVINRGVPGCVECDKEAIRLVKALPAFKPGKNNGVAVHVWYQFPISFGYKNK